MDINEYLGERQKKIDKLEEIVKGYLGLGAADGQEVRTDGLSEDEKEFLLLEKKYKDKITDRSNRIRTTQEKLDDLTKKLTDLETKRTAAKDHEETTKIWGKINVVSGLIEEVETELEKIIGGEPDKHTDEVLEKIAAGKTGTEFNTKKI